jgi:hypothetical protein
MQSAATVHIPPPVLDVTIVDVVALPPPLDAAPPLLLPPAEADDGAPPALLPVVVPVLPESSNGWPQASSPAPPTRTRTRPNGNQASRMRSSFPRKKVKEEASARMLTKIARTDLPQNVPRRLPWPCFRAHHNVNDVTETEKHAGFGRFLLGAA